MLGCFVLNARARSQRCRETTGKRPTSWFSTASTSANWCVGRRALVWRRGLARPIHAKTVAGVCVRVTRRGVGVGGGVAQYRSLWFFLVFYAVFLVVVFLNVSVSETFFARDALREGVIAREMLEADAPNIRKDFNDIGQVSEAWQWLMGPFVETIAQDDAAKLGVVLDFNRLLGACVRACACLCVSSPSLACRRRTPFDGATPGSVRLRQLRVRNDSCDLSEQLNRPENFGARERKKANRSNQASVDTLAAQSASTRTRPAPGASNRLGRRFESPTTPLFP